VVFTSWLRPSLTSPTSLFNDNWFLVFIAGLVLIGVSITPIFCLLGVLGPTSSTIGLGFLPGLARLFLQHCFSIN
jgi:hypothetical protein